MPELPEVEHARRGLTRWAKGRTIAAAVVVDARVVHGGAKVRLAPRLIGRKVMAVNRRGKWLELRLDEGPRLYAHLGMTGKWVSRPTDAPAERFEKVRLDLVRGKARTTLRYIDPRVLGRMRLEEPDPPFWKKLGPDPLHDGVDAKALGAKLAKKPRAIKEALMDQAVLAGIGNILATEALFVAKLHPEARSDRLKPAEVKVLARAVVLTIERSLELETGDEITYVSEARAENPFAVYGRKGEPCPRCRQALVRIVLGGRGTVFCARCQPARA
jgi:formamidopyrimidine-DNA glycosylase